MSNQSKAIILNTFTLSMKGSLGSLLIALISLSFAPIFIKLSEQEISAISTVFNRLWMAAILLGGWNWINQLFASSNNDFDNDKSNVKKFTKTSDIVLVLLVGIISVASGLCWAWSLTQTSVANSTLMRDLSPLFTCIMGWLFFQQRFEARFIGSMLLAILGASLIGIQDLQIGLQHLLGDGLGLLAALFYSLNLLILEYLRRKFSAVTLLFWRCTVSAIVLLPLLWLTNDTFFPHSWQGWAIIFALAMVCQCFGQCVLIHNLKYFSSSFIAILLLIEPTLTAIFAWLIFAENLSPLNSLGFAIVLLGIFLARTGKKSDQTTLMEEKTA